MTASGYLSPAIAVCLTLAAASAAQVAALIAGPLRTCASAESRGITESWRLAPWRTARPPDSRGRRLRRISNTLIAVGVAVLLYAGVILAWGDPVTWLWAHWQQRALTSEFHEPAAAVQDRHAAARQRRRPGCWCARTRSSFSHSAPGGTRVRPADDRPHRPVQGGGRAGHHGRRRRRPQQGARPLHEHALPGAGIDASRSPATAPPTAHGSGTSTRSATATTSTCRCRTPPSTTGCRCTRWCANTDWSIIKPQGYERLVLSACHPLYSASHRWVVFARGVSVTLPGKHGRTLCR